jgi:hypothetical protein
MAQVTEGMSGRGSASRPLVELEAALPHIEAAPKAVGRLELIVRRPTPDAREVLDEARLDHDVGLVGDCWKSKGSSSTPDGKARLDAQVTLTNSRVIETIAGPRELWPFAGDQLYVDFDLSAANLPPGTRLAIGDAVVEVSAHPHTGCAKFAARFGTDAQRFVASKRGRELNLRGVNTRVVVPGRVATGDVVRKS